MADDTTPDEKPSRDARLLVWPLLGLKPSQQLVLYQASRQPRWGTTVSALKAELGMGWKAVADAVEALKARGLVHLLPIKRGERRVARLFVNREVLADEELETKLHSKRQPVRIPADRLADPRLKPVAKLLAGWLREREGGRALPDGQAYYHCDVDTDAAGDLGVPSRTLWYCLERLKALDLIDSRRVGEHGRYRDRRLRDGSTPARIEESGSASSSANLADVPMRLLRTSDCESCGGDYAILAEPPSCTPQHVPSIVPIMVPDDGDGARSRLERAMQKAEQEIQANPQPDDVTQTERTLRHFGFRNNDGARRREAERWVNTLGRTPAELIALARYALRETRSDDPMKLFATVWPDVQWIEDVLGPPRWKRRDPPPARPAAATAANGSCSPTRIGDLLARNGFDRRPG